MADIPALDTTNVDELAYVNISNTGNDLSTFDFSTLTSYYDSYTVYDNGFVGTASFGDNDYLTFTVRIKEDGWITAHTPTTNIANFEGSFIYCFGQQNNNTPVTPFEQYPGDYNGHLDGTSAGPDDLNYYSYKYTGANSIEFFSVNEEYGPQLADFSVLSGTTINGAWLGRSEKNHEPQLQDSGGNGITTLDSANAVDITSDLSPGNDYKVGYKSSNAARQTNGWAIWWS